MTPYPTPEDSGTQRCQVREDGDGHEEKRKDFEERHSNGLLRLGHPSLPKTAEVSGTRGAGSDSLDPGRGGKDLAEHHLLGTENGPVQFLGRDGAG